MEQVVWHDMVLGRCTIYTGWEKYKKCPGADKCNAKNLTHCINLYSLWINHRTFYLPHCIGLSPFQNSEISCLFLCCNKKNKQASMKKVRTRLEMWLYGVSMFCPLLFPFFLLVLWQVYLLHWQLIPGKVVTGRKPGNSGCGDVELGEVTSTAWRKIYIFTELAHWADSV